MCAREVDDGVGVTAACVVAGVSDMVTLRCLRPCGVFEKKKKKEEMVILWWREGCQLFSFFFLFFLFLEICVF